MRVAVLSTKVELRSEPHHPLAAQVGFSLVEALVALLVLSVGLLGLAAMQVTGLRANDSARMRTEVSIAAYDLADRLRAHPASYFLRGQASKGAISISSDDCGDEGSPTDAIGRWSQDFCNIRLPEPFSGAVDCQDSNACGAGNCSIEFRWNDARGEATDAAAGVRDPETLQFRFCTRLATAI